MHLVAISAWSSRCSRYMQICTICAYIELEIRITAIFMNYLSYIQLDQRALRDDICDRHLITSRLCEEQPLTIPRLIFFYLQFISKKNRILTYTYLFKEGTIVAKKDFYKEQHSAELPIPNLEVLGLLKSLKSRGFVTETFNWCHYYYFLTNEGIEFLRTYLAIPAEIVPATLKQPATVSRPTGAPEPREKKSGPGGDFKPSFEGRRDGYRAREPRERREPR